MADEKKEDDLDQYTFGDDDSAAQIPFPKQKNPLKRSHTESKQPADAPNNSKIRHFSIQNPSVHAPRLQYIKGIQNVPDKAESVSIKCVTTVIPNKITTFRDFNALNLVFDQTKLTYKAPPPLTTATTVSSQIERNKKLIIKYENYQFNNTNKWVHRATKYHQLISLAVNPRVIFDKLYTNDRIDSNLWIRKGAAFMIQLADAPISKTREELQPRLPPVSVLFDCSVYVHMSYVVAFYNSLTNITGNTDGILAYIGAQHGDASKTGAGYFFESTNSALLEYITKIVGKRLPLQYDVHLYGKQLRIRIQNNLPRYYKTAYIASSNGINALPFGAKKNGLYMWLRNKFRLYLNVSVYDQIDLNNRYLVTTVNLSHLWDRLGFLVKDKKLLILNLRKPNLEDMRSWICTMQNSLVNGHLLSCHILSPFLFKKEVDYVLSQLCPPITDLHILAYPRPHQIHSNHHSFKFTTENTPRYVYCGVPLEDLSDANKPATNLTLACNTVVINGMVANIVETYTDDIVKRAAMTINRSSNCYYCPSIFCASPGKCERFDAVLAEAKQKKKYEMVQNQTAKIIMDKVLKNMKKARIQSKCGHLSNYCDGCDEVRPQLEDGYKGVPFNGNAPNEQTLIMYYHSYGLASIKELTINGNAVIWDELSTMEQLAFTVNKYVKQQFQDNDIGHLIFNIYKVLKVNENKELTLNQNNLNIMIAKQTEGMNLSSKYQVTQTYSISEKAAKDNTNNKNNNGNSNSSQ